MTHAALLRGGRVTSSGPVEEVLADDPMSACFDLAIVVERDHGRWRARAK